MRRWVAIVVVSTGLAAAGCGGAPTPDAAVVDTAPAGSPIGAGTDEGAGGAEPTDPVGASPDPRADGCVALAAEPWPATPLGSIDPLAAAVDDRLPGLPVSVLAPPPSEVTGVIRADTPEEYLVMVGDPTDPAHIDELRSAGFAGAVNVGYRAGLDSYRIQVKHYGSPDEAVTRARQNTEEACPRAAEAAPIPRVAGTALLRADGVAQSRLAVGDHEVLLEICACVSEPDLLGLVVEWSSQVAAHLATSS